jgi:transcriptional regulator with XRE-family HTH domain
MPTQTAAAISRSRDVAPANGNLDDRVGPEIKHLRKARRMTIAELAKVTDLSVGYLSQVERGRSSPSVKALRAISDALGVTVSWFFAPQTSEHDALRDLVVRASSRRKLVFENGITDELLSPNLGRQLELLRSVFPPGASSGRKPYTHDGEEAGVVLEGQLHLWVGNQLLVLGVGDSFAFESTRPHRYENRGKTHTVVIWAITPPSY